jgi:hypothetical protein
VTKCRERFGLVAHRRATIDPMLSSNPLPFDDHLIDFCDRDSNWGPLLFLRPARKERMSHARTAAGALLLGAPLGLFGSIVMHLFARLVHQQAPGLMYFPLVLTLGYWLVAHITLARAWNQRAARLARWG